MPMTKAEVITTLGSTFAPFKIANSTDVVGSIVQDRHSGIMGVLGKPAHMIPVRLTLHGSGPAQTFHFQVFQNAQWTPFVMLATIFNSISQTNLVSAHASYQLSGAIQMKGYPDLMLKTLSVTPADSQLPPGFQAATWVSLRFNQIFQNRFETPDISAVKLDVQLVPEIRPATIENVWSATSDVHPGDDVPVKISLLPFRGQRITKETRINIPANAPKGAIRVLFSDAETMMQQSP